MIEKKDNYIKYLNKFNDELNYILFEEYKKVLINELEYLLILCENDLEKLRNINNEKINCIDLQKLNFLLNFVLLKIYKKDDYNDEKELVEKYIKHYLDENEHKIKNNYYLENKSLKTNKFSIHTLVETINYELKKEETNIIVPTQDDTSTKNFNYSFFECDESKTREILGKFLRLGESKYNSEKANEFLKRKISFYEKLDYVKLYRGSDSFDGYMGFVLEDGTVILDKFFKNFKTGRITCSDAIYIVSEKDFETITKMSKTECIKKIEDGTIVGSRIPHDDNYEEKVNTVIKKKNLMMQ